MKIIFLIAAIFSFSQPLFCQWGENEDPLTIKELRLTSLQQKEIKQINSQAGVEINWLQKNSDTSVTVTSKIEKIRGGRIKKIINILSPEQQVTWRDKLMQNKPRRGVTGLPYERVVR